MARPDPSVDEDPWRTLASPGGARIGLGRAGGSLPTAPLLAFQLAHARARDAVRAPLDVEALHRQLHDAGHDTRVVGSQAADRHQYLLRPDLGRRLSDAGVVALGDVVAPAGGWDLLLVIADGLSAAAPQRHAWPVLQAAVPVFRRWGWSLAPVVLATQARVALGDDIAARLDARMVAVLIGERPGLSAADSLGIYLTCAPRVGGHDARRNCLSNIRDGGLPPRSAAHSLLYLARRAREIGETGIALKDDSARVPLLIDG